MKNYIFAFILSIFFSSVYADETLIMVRHGEKPENGLGQLSCKGLNRSLKLPEVLISNYGVPAAIFAPNPSGLKNDKGNYYNYLRPLATIEPTAIRLEMPVNADIPFEKINQLSTALLVPKYADKTIFIAWEHYWIEQMAKMLVSQYGDSSLLVPKWESEDFDSIYILTIHYEGDNKTITFRKEFQNLNNLSTVCPQ